MAKFVLAFTAAVLLASPAAWSDDERTLEKRVQADPKGHVEISNVAGTVEVIGWDRAEVELDATYEKGVERIDVTSSGGRTRIRVVLPRNSRRGSEAYLTVRVPQQSELQISTVSAEIETHGVFGRQRLNSVSGNVQTEIADQDLEVRTVSGDVMLRGRGKAAVVRASTVSGNLTLDRGAGELDVQTTSGDLIVELDPASDVRVRTVSGDLSLTGELSATAEVDAETVSGELTARFRGSGFSYEVTSFSGDIDTCFRNQAEPTSRYGPGMRLSGTHGDGKATVRMKTMSGDVEICGR